MTRRRFTFDELIPVFRKVATADHTAIIVGGQAVGGWENHFDRGRAVLGREKLASKDLDLIGDRSTVRSCAAVFGVKPQFPALENVVAAQVGVVTTESPDGSPLRIDVLSNLFGLEGKEIRATAIGFDVENSGFRLQLMHPVLCMESRVHNVAGLPGQYDNPVGLSQLAIAIRCASAYQKDVLDGVFEASDPVRTVLRLNERIVRFATRDPHAQSLLRTHGIDVASAMYVDERLPKAFLETRLPQLRAQLDARRGRENPDPTP